MEIPTTLLERVLFNEGLQLSVATHLDSYIKDYFRKDMSMIKNRFENEGMSFLTITLPSLCDTLDRGLAEGRITPAMFEGFQPFKRSGKLPALLSRFFMRVFNEDGSLLDVPCIDAIRAIRQVTRLFKKVELPCSSARTRAAFERYKSNDESALWNGSDVRDVRGIAGYLWSDLQELSGELYCSPGVFGTGATAERVAFNERHTVREWPERSEDCFPASYHATHSEGDADSLAGIRYLSEGSERPVRVVQVPKTLKTPRIISVEPSYMMLMQQSIAKPLMDYLESDRFQYSGSIRFTDQSVNNRLARIGSIDGSLATIDLKDASDLVSNNLVQHIFGVAPAFLDLIQACRSNRARMPDGSLINLRKFASQGSALCFPIEAMVFFTVIIASIVHRSGRRPSKRLISEITAKISVYGDDIIVPSEVAAGVMEDLEAYGLKVNPDKSFHTGFFRESCGGDYYKGHDVTPAYCRQWSESGSIREPRVLSAYISLSNQFYMKGLWHASQYIRDSVERKFRRTFPRTTRAVGGLTFASVSFDTGLRWSPKRQGFRVRTFVISAGLRDDPVRDIRGAMLLSFGRGHLQSYRQYYHEHGPSWTSSRYECLDWSSESSINNEGSPQNSRNIVCSFEQWKSSQDRGFSVDRPLSRPSLDTSTSVDPYASNMKHRWAEVFHVSNASW